MFIIITLSYIVILHQTTTQNRQDCQTARCLISLFYIKPQPRYTLPLLRVVVLYRYSTSNHNAMCTPSFSICVVLYRYSTSNHNQFSLFPDRPELSYIVILHQTTTFRGCLLSPSVLSYIVILHQTTTYAYVLIRVKRCLISLFYIKPQR